MAFDFPASPAEGAMFAAPGGPTFVFNSPVWKAMGQGQICIISDTPPASAANGQLWWQSSTGKMFVYYVDVSGAPGQWVIASPQGAPGADAIAGIVVSKIRVTRKDQVAVPTGWAATWLISAGVQVLQTGLNVKSAASKLIVKGGCMLSTGGVAQSYGISLYTSLSNTVIGGNMVTQTAGWSSPLHVESEPVSHGQPVGTYVTAQMRASSNNTGTLINATGNGGGLIPAYLDIEEVMI